MKQDIWNHYYDIQNSIDTGTPMGMELNRRLFMLEQYFLPLCKRFKVKKILDVGCAFGATVNYFIKKGFKAKGININKEQLNVDNPIEYGDMHDIPFKDKTFDAIYCAHTFEHSIAPYIALCEFNRVLKKDGLIFITLPEEGNYWTTHYGHFFCPTVRQLAGLLHHTGFESIRQWRSEWAYTPIEIKKDLCFIWQKKIEWNKKVNDTPDFRPVECRVLTFNGGIVKDTEIYLCKFDNANLLRKVNKLRSEIYKNMDVKF